MKLRMSMIGLLLLSSNMHAYKKGIDTKIVHFQVPYESLIGTKNFLNKTGKNIILEWKVMYDNEEKAVQYAQSPVIKKGQSIKISLSKAYNYLLKRGIKRGSKVRVVVSIAAIDKLPQKASVELTKRHLNGSRDLVISKNVFLASKSFILEKASDGQIQCNLA